MKNELNVDNSGINASGFYVEYNRPDMVVRFGAESCRRNQRAESRLSDFHCNQ